MIESDPILGNILASHPIDRARLLLPAGLLVGVVAVVLNFTLAEVDGWGPAATVIVMAAVALGAGWWVLHLWNREVVLYQNGFSYREGGRPVLFLYEEITSIRQRGQQLAYFGGLIRRSTLRFDVTGIRGEHFALTNRYRNIDSLGERLEERTNRVLGPMLESRLKTGEKIPFSDSLRLSNSGLHEGGRNLPWEQFGGYKASGGRLQLLAADGTEWYSAALGEVDNLGLLIGLLREAKGS